jgi:hypothetical protein
MTSWANSQRHLVSSRVFRHVDKWQRSAQLHASLLSMSGICAFCVDANGWSRLGLT